MKIVLGTMTFGESVFATDVGEFINMFIDSGGEELDTAYIYNEGECERLVGRAVKELEKPYRIATKVNPRFTAARDGSVMSIAVRLTAS